MKSSKSILFLSDIHCGSYYAPCTEKPYIAQAKTYWNPTKLQRKLLKYWRWIKEELIQQPYLICINGEPIDGDNKKENGGGLWSNNQDDQINDFCKLMKQYQPKHITMTRGSGYHIQKDNFSFEDIVAQRLGVKPYQTMHEAERYRQWDDNRNQKIIIDDIRTFDVNGCIFNVAHHIGYNKAYHNKSQAVTAMLASLEFMRGKYWKPKDFPHIVVRGHVHYYVLVGFARIRGFTEPTLKLSMDRYFTRQGVPEPPSIGAVEVIVESNGHAMIEPHIITNDMYPKFDITRY